MLASAGTLLLPSPEQASCLQPPPSSTSAIGRRVLQDPPARPTLSIAAQSGKGSKPSLGNHSNSIKFLLLTPLPPPPCSHLCPGSSPGRREVALALGLEGALLRVRRGQIPTLLMLEPASGQEHCLRFTWLLMLLCKQHVNESKCLIHNENISCFFNLLDMEIFFETENAAGRI